VAVSGTLGAVVSYFSMFLITAVSVRTGKKTAMFLGLGLALIGVVGAWFSMDPRWPLAQLLTTVMACMGLQGCWLMVSSMVADVCDEDELKTGLRREGMFGAINGFALKAALSVTALIGGFLLQYTGFNSNEVDQFQSRTITQLIEPVRAWELGEGDLKSATATFDLSATRFIEISEDKSGMEGSKWTIFSRLLKGENVFFRWYDFEDALNIYLDAVAAGEPTAPEPLKAELATFVQKANEGFLIEFKEQKRIALLMKKLIIGFQAVGLVLAMVVFVFYPITRNHAEETRRKLDERKADEAE
jgi:Na+/melibiose symporter-like transporter